MNGLRVAFHTLGCRLNQAETALAADDLSRHGYVQVPWNQPADILVINSCAVTGMASQKSRQAFRAARRQNPGAFIVLMGCDAKVDRLTWEIDGPDLVVPHPYQHPLSTLLQEKMQPHPYALPDDFIIQGAARFEGRTRANLKIQDGCNFCCTYCIVPFARGASRSRDLNDVLRETRELAEAGYKELVLCGVNLTTYFSHGADLADLIEMLLTQNDGFRIRLGSSEPGDVLPKVIGLMKNHSRLCRFLHLPLQYGEDSILRRMHRHYTADKYAGILKEAYQEVPGLCLGADVITGFPGENDETFAKCRQFIENLPFGLLHIFPYSKRPGTLAAKMPDQVPSRLAGQRAAALAEIAKAKAEDFAASQIGQCLQVLVEENNSGWSDNYLHVTLDAPALENNTLINASINASLGFRELRATRM